MPPFHHSMVEDNLKSNKVYDSRLVKRMVRYLKPYAGWVVLAFLLICLLTGIELALPYLMKTAIDNYVRSDRYLVVVPDANQYTRLKQQYAEHGIEFYPNQQQQGGYAMFSSRSRKYISAADDSLMQQQGWLITEPPTKNNKKAAARVYVFDKTPEIKKSLSKIRSWQVQPGKLAATISDVDALNLDIKQKRSLFQKFIDGLVNIGMIYLLLVVSRFLLQYAQAYVMMYFSQNAMYDLRKDLFKHLLRMPLKFFDKNPVGRLVTRSTNDIQSLNEMLSAGFLTMGQDILVLFGIVGLMLWLDWRLTLVSFTIVPFMVFTVRMFMRRMRVIYREVRRRLAQINARLSEDISGMKIIQLFNMYKRKKDDFNETNEGYFASVMKQMQTFALFRPLISNYRFLMTALLLWYGGGRILEGEISLGLFLAFSNYLERFFEPINSLSERFNVLQGAMAGAERVFDLMDQDQDDYRDQLTANKQLQGDIELKNLWLAYNEDEWVLKNINLKIKAGEKVALVGHTGSGKTSIVNLLLGMYPYQKGQILLDNHPQQEYSLQDIRANIGMVQQDVFLFSGNIRDNIVLDNGDINDNRLQEVADDVDVLPFINSLPNRFEQEVTERGSTFSVGQRQLVAFARVLAYNPALFILDEATSNIDTETELHIQKALEAVMANRTSVIIAHRLSTIQHCDRIIVLHKGEIVEEGSHQQLLRQQGIYYSLYKLQYENQLTG